MRVLKVGKSIKGRDMHYSVGAVIMRDGKFLLVDRAKFPQGFACVAGHIEEGESPEHALEREVKEESGLEVTKKELLFEEELDWNTCNKGIGVHHWYLYSCEVKGEPELDPQEAKSIGWYSPAEIGKLVLEPAWSFWFKKMEII